MVIVAIPEFPLGDPQPRLGAYRVVVGQPGLPAGEIGEVEYVHAGPRRYAGPVAARMSR